VSEDRLNHGYTSDELKSLVTAELDSGPGRFGSMEEMLTEARGRL
jgi:hypothetical protein